LRRKQLALDKEILFTRDSAVRGIALSSTTFPDAMNGKKKGRKATKKTLIMNRQRSSVQNVKFNWLWREKITFLTHCANIQNLKCST
jgi:hypothetical protein